LATICWSIEQKFHLHVSEQLFQESLWKWSDERILINKWGWLFCVFEYFSKTYSNYLCSIVNLKHCWFLIIEISLFSLSWLWFRNKQRIKHWKYFSIYNLKKEHHLYVGVWKWRLVSAKCIICESLKDLICKLKKNNNNAKEYELKLKKYNLHQK
jgi:hypothetical protein